MSQRQFRWFVVVPITLAVMAIASISIAAWIGCSWLNVFVPGSTVSIVLSAIFSVMDDE